MGTSDEMVRRYPDAVPANSRPGVVDLRQRAAAWGQERHFDVMLPA